MFGRGKVFASLLSAACFCHSKFYEDQLALINSIESILDPERDEKEAEQILRRKHEERMIHLLTVVTLITNIVC